MSPSPDSFSLGPNCVFTFPFANCGPTTKFSVKAMLAFCSLVGSVASATHCGLFGKNRTSLERYSDKYRKCAQSNSPPRVVIVCGRRGNSGRDSRRRGDGRRPNRVAELIRREMSPIIDDAFSRAFADDDDTSSVFVSIVDVKCSADLRSARLSVSVLGTDEQKNKALQWLKGARKELRFELAQCVQLKYIPELSFMESEMVQALKTVNVLDRLVKEREEKRARSLQATGEMNGMLNEETLYTAGQDLDLDASADDGLILDDLEIDGVFDLDGDDDPHIVDVTDDDEQLEGMNDDDLKRAFNTSEDEGIARRR